MLDLEITGVFSYIWKKWLEHIHCAIFFLSWWWDWTISILFVCWSCMNCLFLHMSAACWIHWLVWADAITPRVDVADAECSAGCHSGKVKSTLSIDSCMLNPLISLSWCGSPPAWTSPMQIAQQALIIVNWNPLQYPVFVPSLADQYN